MPEMPSSWNLYALRETRKVRLRVHYPNDLEQMVIRTELDWDKDIVPSTIDRAASFAEFDLELSRPFLYFKPCLHRSSGVLWATGPQSSGTSEDKHQ
jgi:hypothetical protein